MTRPVLVTITSRQKMIYFVLPARNQVINVCSHEESDIPLVLHASKVDSDDSVVREDTAVLVLMIWVYSKLNITNNLYLKYEHEQFAAKKIYSYLSKKYPP